MNEESEEISSWPPVAVDSTIPLRVDRDEDDATVNEVEVEVTAD